MLNAKCRVGRTGVFCPPGTWPLPGIRNEDGSLKHVYCEGARGHVLYWDSYGEHCSEPDCEINRVIGKPISPE